MFNSLETKLTNIIKQVRGKTVIQKGELLKAINAIKITLIEADVNLQVVNDLIQKITNEIKDYNFSKEVGFGEQFVKIVFEEIKNVLGKNTSELKVNKNKVYKMMLVGNQGSGKTTTIIKIANYLKSKKLKTKPLIIAADIYRYAAIEQLQQLAKEHNFLVFSKQNTAIVTIIKEGINYAYENDCDAILVDTAGRFDVDQNLMKELEEIQHQFKPEDILFVADSMVGQEIANTALNFQKSLNLTGCILSKVDSESRAGGVLSITMLAKIPILFMGTGEKIKDLEIFHPERFAKRILGMGDVITLVEKVKEHIDENTAIKIQKKILNGTINLNDLLTQLKVVKKMGASTLLKMIPGMGGLQQNQESINKEIKITEALINSMTKLERIKPKLLKQNSRKQRIINGCGLSSVEFNRLLKKFEQMQSVGKLLKNNPFANKFRF